MSGKELKKMTDAGDWNGVINYLASCKIVWHGKDAGFIFDSTQYQWRIVKHNPKRLVVEFIPKQSEAERAGYFLKVFLPQRNILKCGWRYARKEYKFAVDLQNCEIPIIEYLAWGRFSGRGGVALSKAEADAVSGREYFYRTARKNPELRRLFFEKFCDIINRLFVKKIFHPDFHSGNVIVLPNGEVKLVDPWNVHSIWFWTQRRLFRMCSVWYELRFVLTDEEIRDNLSASIGALRQRQSEKIWHQALKYFEKIDTRRWKKLGRRILGGKSKFTTCHTDSTGTIFYWRNTYWYTPPEKYEINPLWNKLELTGDNAQALWVNSFQNPIEPLPVLWIHRKNQHDTLFFDEKK